jgi:hypothetical protein
MFVTLVPRCFSHSHPLLRRLHCSKSWVKMWGSLRGHIHLPSASLQDPWGCRETETFSESQSGILHQCPSALLTGKGQAQNGGLRPHPNPKESSEQAWTLPLGCCADLFPNRRWNLAVIIQMFVAPVCSNVDNGTINLLWATFSHRVPFRVIGAFVIFILPPQWLFLPTRIFTHQQYYSQKPSLQKFRVFCMEK